MKKNAKEQDPIIIKKAVPDIPKDPLLTEAAQIPSSRDAKTNVAIPSDENVMNARNYVDENKK